MILNYLKANLPEYEVKIITEEDYEKLYALQKSNPEYFSYLHDHEVTKEECIDDVIDLPPNTTMDQKFYVGFFRAGHLEIVLDYVEGFPDGETVWIGFLMVDGYLKRKGLGRKVVQSFIKATEVSEFDKIQLGVIENNLEGMSFWYTFGFDEIRRSPMDGDDGNIINVIVLEKQTKLTELRKA